jgi:hypothetical protein
MQLHGSLAAADGIAATRSGFVGNTFGFVREC